MNEEDEKEKDMNEEDEKEKDMNEEDEKEKDMNEEDEKEKDSKNDEPITSVSEFLERIKNLLKNDTENDTKNDTYIYRGEPERYASRNSSLLRDEKNIDRKNKIEQYKPKLDEYRRTVFAEISSLERKSFLAFSQHHGLSTNLIDISRNPYVALWFACQYDKDKECKDGYVYVYKESKTIDITEFIEDNEKLFYKNNYNLIDMLYNPVSSSRSSNGNKYDLLTNFEDNVLDKISYDDAWEYMQTLLEFTKLPSLDYKNIYFENLKRIYSNLNQHDEKRIILPIIKDNNSKKSIQTISNELTDLIKDLNKNTDLDKGYRELIKQDLSNCIKYLKSQENTLDENYILYIYKAFLKMYFNEQYYKRSSFTIDNGISLKKVLDDKIDIIDKLKEYSYKFYSIITNFNDKNTEPKCLYNELKNSFDELNSKLGKNEIFMNQFRGIFKKYDEETIDYNEVRDYIIDIFILNHMVMWYHISDIFTVYLLIINKTKNNLGFKYGEVNKTINSIKKIFIPSRYSEKNEHNVEEFSLFDSRYSKPLDDLSKILEKIIDDNIKQDEPITGDLLDELNEAFLNCSSIRNLNYFPNLVYKPILTFKRGINQQGLFFYQTFVNLVINNETYAITQQIQHDHRIKIPKEHKKSISDELDLLGINRAFIYGDYDNIAKYLEEYKYNPNK